MLELMILKAEELQVLSVCILAGKTVDFRAKHLCLPLVQDTGVL